MVWRRGSYAARGASLAPNARAASGAPTQPVVEAADNSKTEVVEDCGCGEAVSLDDLKANIKVDIEKVGEIIRVMKSEGIKDKALLQPHIDDLLALKAKWLSVTGQPYDLPKPGAKPKNEVPKKQAAPAAKGGKGGAEDGDFKITPRAEDYSKWYQDVISAAYMVDQSPVKGCMVIRPWGMAVWDELKDDLNRRIKAKGVQNAYFPLFIPMSFLSKEAEHVEGFAKECAVVTHHRLCANPDGSGLMPDPEAKLEEPVCAPSQTLPDTSYVCSTCAASSLSSTPVRIALFPAPPSLESCVVCLVWRSMCLGACMTSGGGGGRGRRD